MTKREIELLIRMRNEAQSSIDGLGRGLEDTARRGREAGQGLGQMETGARKAGQAARDSASYVDLLDGVVSRLTTDQREAAMKAELYAAAIEDVGGASKLTAAQQKEMLSAIEAGIDSFGTLGRDVPAHVEKVRRELDGASTATDKNTLSVKGMVAGWVAGYATIEGARRLIGGLNDFVTDSIEAHGKQEAATKKLTTAMRQQGTAIPGLISQYDRLASQFESTTTYADDTLTEMQALLVQVGDVMPSKMERALEASTDLASGLGIDLRTSAMLVGKAFAGETETLTRYGVVIDHAAFKARGADVVLDAIHRKFGGQARAETETYLGQMEQLANAYDNLQEFIGETIVESDLFYLGLRQLKSATDDLKAATDANVKVSLPWSAYLKAMPPILGEIADGLQEITQEAALLAHLEDEVTRQAESIAERRRREIEDREAKPVTLGLEIDRRDREATEKARKQAAEEQKRLAEAWERTQAAVKAIDDDGVLWRFYEYLPDLSNRTKEFREALERLEPTDSFADLAETLPDVTGKLQDARDGALDFATGVNVAADAIKNADDSVSWLSASWEKFTKGITSKQAAQMGITKGLSLLEGLEGTGTGSDMLRGAAQGAQVGMMFTPIGAAIGAGVGALAGAFAKSQGKAVNDLRDQFIGAAGGLHALNVQAHEAGMSLDALLAARDEEGLQRAISDLEAGFARFEARVQSAASSILDIGARGGLITDSILREISTLRDNPQIRAALAEFLEGQTSQGLGALGGIAAGAKFTSAEGAAGVGLGAVALVEQMREQGASVREIAEAAGPAIEELQRKFEEAGLSGGEAFENLAGYIGYLNDEAIAPLLDSAGDVVDLMTVLHNTARLDEETFRGLARQVADTKAELDAMGKGGEEALRAMQPDLQRIWELADKFGWQVDEDTQALLDEAEAAGLIGEAFRPATDKMIEAIDRLIERFDLFLGRFEEIPRDVDVDVNYHEHNRPDFEPHGEREYGGEDEGPREMAAGGIYATGARGVATWFGEGGEPELGGPVDFMSRVLARAMGSSGRGFAQDIHINIDGHEIAHVTYKYLPEVLQEQGIL